ncbi:threonine-phosphate decarboxylase [Priestia aryabhattai]|uniref:threonine-phosphate decarboxylase CobD n=1 Tax=Priestia aryabhattai TaxID=412384 RepID=UPI001C0D2F34|nr:threonine-phosphate decarboxylase CobD [Priestia aryabhattai]MBU3569778.1 threonine-phosphate decarboxylase [Priestia aryabhattai]
MLLPTHGANPDVFLKAIGAENLSHIKDFSVNTNPLGAPPVLHEKWNEFKDAAFSYPDPQVTELKNKLAAHHRVSTAQVLPTNGAAEAFFLIASLFSKEKAGIVQPTFVEYEQASKAYGCEVTYVPLAEENGWSWDIELIMSILPDIKVLWICHPNNPTGVMYSHEEWMKVVKAAAHHGTYLMIDEAFIDFVEHQPSFDSLILDYEHIIVVRSMTKMFNIAGLRLGYILANKKIISEMSKKQPPWSVNGLSQQVGMMCVDEQNFVKNTVHYIKQERKRILSQLKEWGLLVSPSQTNYYLCSVPSSIKTREWLVYLASYGVVARHTENFPFLNGRYIRLAVKTKEENDYLLNVIKQGLDEI